MSHKVKPGGRVNRAPFVFARAATGVYNVLHRNPQVPGDPEHAVARGTDAGNVIALFYGLPEAEEYCAWKNNGKGKE